MRKERLNKRVKKLLNNIFKYAPNQVNIEKLLEESQQTVDDYNQEKVIDWINQKAKSPEVLLDTGIKSEADGKLLVVNQMLDVLNVIIPLVSSKGLNKGLILLVAIQKSLEVYKMTLTKEVSK